MNKKPFPSGLSAALALLACAGLAGCATTKEEIIPQSGPSMLEIYRSHQLGSGVGMPPVVPAPAATPQPGAMPTGTPGALPAGRAYAREEADVLRQRFARLPNPDLVMYVPPHLSAAGTPVPGYVTVLPMYERVEYALPGEVSPSALRLAE